MGVETAVPTLPGQAWGSLRLKPSNTDTREWPNQMEGDACWDSSTFQSEEDFILVLDEDEVAEVRGAVRHFNGESQRFVNSPCGV